MRFILNQLMVCGLLAALQPTAGAEPLAGRRFDSSFSETRMAPQSDLGNNNARPDDERGPAYRPTSSLSSLPSLSPNMVFLSREVDGVRVRHRGRYPRIDPSIFPDTCPPCCYTSLPMACKLMCDNMCGPLYHQVVELMIEVDGYVSDNNLLTSS